MSSTATPRRTDSHHSASSECQKANQHLCQPWEIHQVYETGYYRDIHVPIQTENIIINQQVMQLSRWYTYAYNDVLVNRYIMYLAVKTCTCAYTD